MLLCLSLIHNFICKFGWTAIHEAADKGYPDVVRLLASHGAKLNEPTVVLSTIINI